MDRTGAQHAGEPLRLRAIAVLLLALLFGLQLTPLLQAQTSQMPDCCMAAEGKGCSMHLHRAMQAQQSGHSFAALQPRCPCTPMAPANAGGHGSASLSASRIFFLFAAERATMVQLRSLRGVLPADSGGTRGPPVTALTA